MPETKAQLGQFFTPRPVIDVSLQMLEDLGGSVAGARVCDPACGPGEWLHSALEAGADQALGVDCDASMFPRWRESGLVADQRCHLAVADGLSPALKLAHSADVVLGNPPFGAELSDSRESALRDLARHYHLFRPPAQAQLIASPSASDLKRIRRCPTEVLFLERFVEICRPGGWIAIILPEGVFANARWRHLRRWLLERLTVHVVAALPRCAFRSHSTTARTCLMLMRRCPAPPGHEVALAEVDACTRERLASLRDAVADVGGAPVADDLDLWPPIFAD